MLTERFPRIEFKIELLRRGMTLMDIARCFRVSRPLISSIIADRYSSPHRPRLVKMYRDMERGAFKRLEDY